MGEAKRKKERGEAPSQRERFEAGPVRIGPGRLDWVFLEEDGRVRRLTLSARIRAPEVIARVHEAAKRTDSRIVRPTGNELVRPAHPRGADRA